MASILALGIILGEGTLREKIANAKSVALRAVVYTVLDWALAAISAVIAGVLFKEGFIATSLAMWVFDFVAAIAIYKLCLASKQDITLGREYRKAHKEIMARSKVAGAASMAFFVSKGVVWDGPERLLEFWFEKFEGHFMKQVVTLVILTAVQALFWSVVYRLGLAGFLA